MAIVQTILGPIEFPDSKPGEGLREALRAGAAQGPAAGAAALEAGIQAGTVTRPTGFFAGLGTVARVGTQIAPAVAGVLGARVAIPGFTGGTGGSGGFDLPNLIGTTATTLIGALAERIGGQLPAGTQPITGMPPGPAGIAQGLMSIAQGSPAANGPCGCQPRPGKCDPQYVERDFGGFGFGNPCSADPRYPRPTTFQGEPVCGPARRRPRMNPLNPRAAGRAARRLVAAKRAFRRIDKAIKVAAR